MHGLGHFKERIFVFSGLIITIQLIVVVGLQDIEGWLFFLLGFLIVVLLYQWYIHFFS